MIRLSTRIWERASRGGAIAVYKTGPKEATIEVLGCELFEAPYFRDGFHGVILGVLRLATARAYVKEKRCAPDEFVAQMQWA
jgi:hypothetical protein